MSFKVGSLVLIFVAAAYCQQGGSGGYQGGYSQPANYQHQEEHYEPPKYEFAYKVEDEHTGDYKEQHETRDGDVTKGFYWLLDADGYRRFVEYSVEGKSGFQAKVTREPTEHKPQVARPVHKVAAVPVVPVHQAPVYHASVQAPVYRAPVQAPVYRAPVQAPVYRAPVQAPVHRAPAPIHPPARQ